MGAGPAVVIVDAGGSPVTQVADGASAPPFTVVEDRGVPMTLVDEGGVPVNLFNPDGTVYTGLGPNLLDWSDFVASNDAIVTDEGATLFVQPPSPGPGSGFQGVYFPVLLTGAIGRTFRAFVEITTIAGSNGLAIILRAMPNSAPNYAVQQETTTGVYEVDGVATEEGLYLQIEATNDPTVTFRIDKSTLAVREVL